MIFGSRSYCIGFMVIVIFCVLCILGFFYKFGYVIEGVKRVWMLVGLFGIIRVEIFSWVIWWENDFIRIIFYIWWVLFCFIGIIIVFSRICVVKFFFWIWLIRFSWIWVVKFIFFRVEVIRLIFFVWWILFCFFSRIVEFFRIIFIWIIKFISWIECVRYIRFIIVFELIEFCIGIGIW